MIPANTINGEVKKLENFIRLYPLKKDLIIETTIQLIEEKPSGEPSIREIASTAGTSLGLINYYFGSRERLIREAVRFHINTHVILTYSPEVLKVNKKMRPVERLSRVIMGILNYLMEHQKLSRASILNDLAYPESGDNSDLSWTGLKDMLVRILNHVMSEKENIAVWSLIGSIHETFLRPELFHTKCGLSLENEDDRLTFATYLAKILLV